MDTSHGRRPLALLSTVLAAATALTLAGAVSPVSAAEKASTAPVARPGEPAWLTQARARDLIHLRDGKVVTNGPNPRLALVGDDSTLDVAGWRRQEPRLAAQRAVLEAAQERGRSTTTATTPAPQRLSVTEKEPAGVNGQNDTLATAQKIASFGTGSKATPAAGVTGSLSADPKPKATRFKPNVEDDSSFETARDTGVSTKRAGFATTGFIGDNPPVEGEEYYGDLDLYKVTLTAGQVLGIELEVTSGDLQPIVYVFSEEGVFLGEDWDGDASVDLSLSVRTAGTYYVVLESYWLYDEETGIDSLTTGDYAIELTARQGDVDTYAVDLAGGDVLGVNVDGAARGVTLWDASGAELMGSGQDLTWIFPAATPLPGGGNAVAETVAARAGRYYVSIAGGDGMYTADLEVYRPGSTAKVEQTIFLDLDGQRLNTGIFGGRGVTTLSPLSSFLQRWGLPSSARRSVVREIKETVVENIEADLAAAGLSSTVSVNVVTSDDVADPWGQPGVSRVIIGGTIEESGVGTIGIAQSIDPGNFAREETALVLLDLLSEPGSLDDAPYSINTYLTSGSDKVAFVGQAVGNVAAHEVGHLIGNWHTDNSNYIASLMDAGGNFALLFGVGRDRIGGTADDKDVDFTTDTFDLWEGFTGKEKTKARSAWAFAL